MHEVCPIDADKAWSTYFSNSFRSVFFTIVALIWTYVPSGGCELAEFYSLTYD